MKNRFTSTLVMLGLLIGLSAWYFLYEQKYKPEQKDKEEQSKKLVALEADQVNEFVLTRLKNPPPENSKIPVQSPEYESIEIKKTGKDWFIVSPIQTKGDNTTIFSLLSAVCSAKQERVVEEKPKDLSIFGLNNPLVKITLKKDTTAPAQELWVGGNTPVAYSIYAKTQSSEAVYKTSRSIKSSVDKDLFALRDKSVVALNRNDLKEVEIQTGKESLILARDEKNHWTLSRENIPADSLEWEKTLTPLIELKAIKVAAEKNATASQFGLNNPLAKITFVKNDQSRQVLLLGKTKTGLFAKREDMAPVFEVDQSLEEKVTTQASQYRDKHIAQFDRYTVAKIKLDNGKEPLELNKEANSNWVLSSDKAAKLDTAQIDNLLTKLQDIKLTQYLNTPMPKQLENQNLKITLFEKKEQGLSEVLNLSFAIHGKNQIKGYRNGLPLLFEISKEDFDKLNIGKQSLIKTEEKTKEAGKLQKKS
jgi:flagellar basal body-associated protein FliL